MRLNFLFIFFLLFLNYLQSDSVSKHVSRDLADIHLKDPLGDSNKIWQHPSKIKCSQKCPDDYYCPEDRDPNAICLLKKKQRKEAFCQVYKQKGIEIPKAIQAAHGSGNVEDLSTDPLAGERWRAPASMPCKTRNQCKRDYICGKYINNGLCALENQLRAAIFCSQK